MASMSLQAAYDQTRHWIENNDPERAIGLAQHILTQYPDNLEAYRVLGEAYLASRQLDQAQESFERVLQSDPENIPAHVGLGITYERQGKLDRAVPEFEQAWEIKPDMTELRTQLLRLYTDAWGSEHAQLRLSRAGLARLYAKGHMLPQAITEFRQVIAEQPTRHDTQVALAEALWRDGQEQEAITLCRSILTQYPKSLKASLILGYLLLAQGKPEGQSPWQAATDIDPYQAVAKAMFDTLPATTVEEPVLADWDEDAWRRQQELDKQPVPAATRPIPVAVPNLVEAPPARVAQANASINDDFLAVLLAGTGTAAAKPTATPIVEDGEPLSSLPFSLDDINSTATNTVTPAKEPQPVTPPDQPDEPALTPFSFSDLGLSDDEIASLDDATTPASATDEPALTPFSFSDLGLSDDEIASLDDINAPSSAPAPEPDEPALTPFSFSDLGLSDDEIASLNDATTPAPATDEPALTPFSFSDLGLSDDEIASLNDINAPSSASATEPDEPELTPFSFSDLGLSDDEIASLNNTGTAGGTAENSAKVDNSDLPPDLLPFSLDDFDMGGANDNSTLPSSLQPFSLDEAPQEQPRFASFNPPDTNYARGAEPLEDDDDLTLPQSGGYSWQQPTQRTKPNYLNRNNDRDPLMPEGETIFEKLKHLKGKEADLPPLINTPPPSVQGTPESDRPIFSADDISLRDGETNSVANPLPAANLPEDLSTGLSSGQIQPFSLSDLGLNAEEIAALGIGRDTGEAQSFTSMLGDAEPQAATTPVIEPASPSTEQNSDFNALDFGFDTPTEAAPVPAANNTAPADDEGFGGIEGLSPFSLTDLGLSEEEIDALGLEDPIDAHSGLDITEEELAGLDLGGDIDLSNTPTVPTSTADTTKSEPQSSSDVLLDRLLVLGHEQGYVDIADIIAGVENPEAEAERIEQIGRFLHENNVKIFDGDEEVDMDAEYATDAESNDLAQIDFNSAVTEKSTDEPNMTPFSFADLGLSDDEIASLGLGETAAPAVPSADTGDTPDMTPFSFADLGLSDDEIASLSGGGEVTSESTALPEAATPASFEEIVQELPPVPAAEPVATQPAPTPAPMPLVQPRQSPGLSNTVAAAIPALDGYLQQLAADPQNHTLRLSLARISGQIGQTEAALQQYKNIVRQNVLLDLVADDLQDFIADTDEPKTLHQLHRMLGDVYSKQGRIEQAMAEYSWTYPTN